MDINLPETVTQLLLLFGATLMAELFPIDYPDRRAVSASWMFVFVINALLGPAAAGVAAGGASIAAGLLRQRGWRAMTDGLTAALCALLASGVVMAIGPQQLTISWQAALSSAIFATVYTGAAMAANKLLPDFSRQVDPVTNFLLVPVAVVLPAVFVEGGTNGLAIVTGGFAALVLVVRSSVNAATANGELKRAYAHIEQQQSQLEAALELNREYAQVIGHDLRGPLTSIMGHAELLIRGTPEVDQARAQRILHNGKRMARLIDSLQALSTEGESEAGFETNVVDPAAVLQSVVEDLRPGADDRRINARLKITPELPSIITNEWMLREIIDNLVSNAIKYSPEGGSVDVRLDRTNGDLRLEVQDHGIGMSTEDQSRIFNRFFRSSAPQVRSLPGTGLGLALAHSMAQRLGGRIEVRSQLGQGSCFTVLLPIQIPAESRCA